jgi:hypothetical protein
VVVVVETVVELGATVVVVGFGVLVVVVGFGQSSSNIVIHFSFVLLMYCEG